MRRAGPNDDTWIAEWRDGGRQVQRGLGFVHSKQHPDGLTRAKAEVALGKLREQVAIERAAERAAEAKHAAEERRRPLAQVGEALIAAKRAAGRKPSTIEAYSYWLRIHIIDFFGPTPVGEITREDVRGFAAALERKGLAPKSRANALGTLHSLIEFAIDEGWMLGENPVKRVEKPALADDRPRRPLPRDRGGRDAAARGAGRPARPGRARHVPDRGDDRHAPGRAVRAALARRRLERAAHPRAPQLRPRRVRHAEVEALVAERPAREPRRHRAGALSQESRWKSDDDLVFAHPETGKPIDRSKLLKRFKAALRRADVRAVRFHDLRHTFGTRMAAQGVPMRVLQELMGHRDFKTTLIYADYAPSEREAEWVEEAFRPAAPDAIDAPATG